MENDRAFGHIIQESKGYKTISDYFAWMKIATDASNANPYRVVEFKQEMHFDWKAFLSQFYVKSRDTIDAFHAKLSGAVWRSYGCSEEVVKQPDGSVKSELVYHPGEVWLRYSHSDKEAWTKLDLRRDCKKKDQYIYSRNAQGFMCNVSTGDLPESTKKVSEREGSSCSSHNAWHSTRLLPAFSSPLPTWDPSGDLQNALSYFVYSSSPPSPS